MIGPMRYFRRRSLAPSAQGLATGGQIITSGEYTYHIFTSTSSLVVDEPLIDADILVVGGGGGGSGNGGNYTTGGGGGGGVNLILGFSMISSGTHAVTIGAGGSPGWSDGGRKGYYGGSSSLGSIATASGGEGGAYGYGGASGSPPGTAGRAASTSGGSGAAGQASSNLGGPALLIPEFTIRNGGYFGAGGGGYQGGAANGGGGMSTAGTANTGGGGGCGNYNTGPGGGGAGGSGIVIIRYKI